MNFSESVWYTVFVQFVGIIGLTANVLSYQYKSHKKIMVIKTISEIAFALQYLLLGGYTGMLLSSLGCFRNYIFGKRVEEGRNVKGLCILFSAIFTVSGMLTWNGFLSIIAVVSKVLSTIAYSLKNTNMLKTFSVITSIIWLIYDICLFSLGGIISDLFCLISIIIYFK